MFRLASMLYSLIATTLAGSAVVVALISGYDDLAGIAIAAAIGAVLALPASWAVARRLYAA